MKLLFILLLLPMQSWAISGEELFEAAEQFKNRNWNYHAATYGRQAHLLDYTDTSIIEDTKVLIDGFVSQISNLSAETAELFYPELKIQNSSDLINIETKYSKIGSTFEVLQGWDNFLIALESDRWEDPDPNACEAAENIIASPDCGRRTKGNFAITNLTSDQRSNLASFKEIVLDELDLIKNGEFDLPVGPGPARIFQFIFDPRSIDKLIQVPYIQATDPNDPDFRKRNIVDIARALIIQIFQGKYGTLENSNFTVIDLESDECFIEDEEKQQDMDCQLNYFKKLVWDREFQSDQLVTNLILDPKGIRPVLDALALKFSSENPEAVTREQMQEFLERVYFSLCLVYELSPDENHYSAFNTQFKRIWMQQMMAGSEYLLGKRGIVSLQLSRGIQDLIIYLETL